MTRNRTGNYSPEPPTAEYLTRGFDHVKSVPYGVSTRWVFYRLWDEGYFSRGTGDAEAQKTAKFKAYNSFKKACANARHNSWGGWRPDTLIDDTRSITYRASGYDDEEEAIDNIEVFYDKYANQDYLAVILFEARAMQGQFEHYTEGIPLVASGGDNSIANKWKVARYIKSLTTGYDKPVVVIYFGDMDDKGGKIQAVNKLDILRWCGEVKPEWVYAGLNQQQVDSLGLDTMEGKYQWESLTDEQARDIITEAVAPYWDTEIVADVEQQELDTAEKWKKILKEHLEEED